MSFTYGYFTLSVLKLQKTFGKLKTCYLPLSSHTVLVHWLLYVVNISYIFAFNIQAFINF